MLLYEKEKLLQKIFLNSVSVEEGTSVRITEYDLQVVHAQMEPEDIKYTVTSGQPNNFHLFRKKKKLYGCKV